MSNNVTLKVEKRTDNGKGAARSLRNEGRIPAIIYGGKSENIGISLSEKDIETEYNKGGFTSKVVSLELDGKQIKAIAKDVQLHPVTDRPLHADFLQIADDSEVKVKIRVKFENIDKAPGIKRGGVLNIVRREVELFCKASHIPEKLTADLTGLHIGDSIHISNITLPEDARPTITDRDFTIATITGRMAQVEETTTAAEAGAEEAEKAEEGEGKEEAK